MRESSQVMDLQKKLADLLARYRAEPSPDLLRQAAELVVDVRTDHFLREDGSPDYAGRTWSYRAWMRGAMTAVPPAERNRLQAALRYHVSAALRERVPAEELAEQGLSTLDARGRQHQQREEAAARTRLAYGRSTVRDAEEIEELVQLLERAAQRLDLCAAPPALRQERQWDARVRKVTTKLHQATTIL